MIKNVSTLWLQELEMHLSLLAVPKHYNDENWRDMIRYAKANKDDGIIVLFYENVREYKQNNKALEHQ